MTRIQTRQGLAPVVATVVALAAVRIVLGVLLWEPGWSALTWDDFTRVALGIEWADDPFLVTDSLVWLPLQTWVYGVVWWVAGGWWPGSPMALFAVVNTVAAFATAGLVGWTAWRLFRSRAGAVVGFAVVLFSPWVTFTSLSALNESLWYLAVAGSVAGLVGWLQTGSRPALGLGAVAVAAGAAVRYDGWTWAAAWLAIVAAWQLGLFPRLTGKTGEGSLGERLRAGWPVLAIAAAPLLVPAGYVVINWIETGDPLHFAKASTETFTSAFGTLPPLRRLTYYPGALVRSAPLLLLALVAIAALAWRRRLVRLLTALVVLQLGLFYLPSLVSSAVGAFAERFMFALVLALAPLIGAVPGLLRRLGPRLAWAAGATLVVAAVAVGVVRTADPPVEWTHAPDLLELNATLGRATADDGELRVALGQGMGADSIPIATQNGERVQLTDADSADIVIERLPARVQEIATQPDAVIGRYHLYGDAARRLEIDTDRCGCAGWVVRDDTGAESAAPAGPYLALEFVADDPAPGSEVVARRTVARGDEPQILSSRLRWLYGQGFNEGRLLVEVRVDGENVFTGVVGTRSRWIEVDLPIPAGPGESLVEIAVVAQPGIEAGWGWGRSSTVLVTAAGAHR